MRGTELCLALFVMACPQQHTGTPFTSAPCLYVVWGMLCVVCGVSYVKCCILYIVCPMSYVPCGVLYVL